MKLENIYIFVEAEIKISLELKLKWGKLVEKQDKKSIKY